MVRNHLATSPFPGTVAFRNTRLFTHIEPPAISFPIQAVRIHWDPLIAKRPGLLETLNALPAYRRKPEILLLIDEEIHPIYRLILDLMWNSCACITEVVAQKTVQKFW